MGNLLWTVIIGAVVGAVAKFLMPGVQGGGIVMTVLLGIAGSVVATFAGQAVGLYAQGQGAGFIASVVGAIVVMWLYGKFRGKGGGPVI